MIGSTSPALKINLSALLHHLFSIMFPLGLISIHIPAGHYYLRINNNVPQGILFLVLYSFILIVGAPHSNTQYKNKETLL